MFDNAKYFIRMIFPVWGHLIRNAFSKFIGISLWKHMSEQAIVIAML